MDPFDKKYIYPFLQGLSLIFLRFIDDVFFIWTGTQEQLTNCLNDLNEKHKIKKYKKYRKLPLPLLTQNSLFKITNLLQKSAGKALTAKTLFCIAKH